MTDAGLKELAGLKSLQTLNLYGTQVTDAGLKELAGLKSLQTLDLPVTQVTDAGLKELAGLKSLQTLNLANTKVTDAGLKELAGLKSLQALHLYHTKVTDAGLKELAGLKSLQSLDLEWTKVTDAGLKELAGLKSLQKLNLLFTGVTGEGLKELAGLKGLQSLVLDEFLDRNTEVKELQKALPGAEYRSFVRTINRSAGSASNYPFYKCSGEEWCQKSRHTHSSGPWLSRSHRGRMPEPKPAGLRLFCTRTKLQKSRARSKRFVAARPLTSCAAPFNLPRVQNIPDFLP